MTIDQGNEPSPGNPSAKMDSNISSPSSNPGDLPPPRYKPIPSTSFLFVNETGESSGYKKGYRRDIRSHVRKHAAKLNTRLKREASQSRLKSLVPQTPEQDDSEPPIDQEDSQSDLADASTPSFKNENSPLLMNCLPFRAPSVVPEWSTTSDCRAPTIQFITEPTIIGSPDASAPDCTGDYLCSCNLCGEKSNSSRSNQTAKRKAGSMIVKRQKLNKRPQLSPFSVLGAGRVDPFSSYPVSDPDNSLHELMDFVVTYFVPGLRPDDAPQLGTNSTSGANSVSRAWYTAGLATPLLFHALAFAGLIHQDYMRSSQIYPNSPQALSHKLVVIKKLNEVIGDGSEFSSSDQVILAILILASHETLKVTEEDRKPFNSPLKRAQWLNVYGNIKYVPEHRKAVLDLLNLRGGLETLKLPGLAETIVGGDIMTAVNGFTKPILPQLRSHENYISAVKVWATTQYRNPVQTLASAFWHLQDYGITDSMLQVLDGMGALTLAFRHYLQGKPGGLTLGQLVRTRTAIEKRLLMLPGGDELNIATMIAPNVYECCRLTAMIFGVAVVLPIPNTYDVLQLYVTRLKAAIEESHLDTLSSQYANLSELFLWILMLGGIAALDKPERRWFVSQLALLVDKLRVDWRGVEGVLETFLWLDSACGPRGRELWAKIEGLAI